MLHVIDGPRIRMAMFSELHRGQAFRLSHAAGNELTQAIYVKYPRDGDTSQGSALVFYGYDDARTTFTTLRDLPVRICDIEIRYSTGKQRGKTYVHTGQPRTDASRGESCRFKNILFGGWFVPGEDPEEIGVRLTDFREQKSRMLCNCVVFTRHGDCEGRFLESSATCFSGDFEMRELPIC